MEVTFKGKSTGGYTGDGFKYLHFLIQNKHDPVSVQKLDKLNGILIKDQEDNPYHEHKFLAVKRKYDDSRY